ncbi:claudin-14-like [Hoplias malabaricus]|uniref:claudin-14-like n=1 Tax=Hoplias malabaricus TaxID=27720 RepID=UPI0034635571
MAESSMTTQLLAYFLALLGLIGTLVAMALPHWHHTAYFTSNLITAMSYMKGLWMECVTLTTGIYQCEVHRSMLSLPQDLQVARAFMVLSAATSTMASIISAPGMKCTKFFHQSPAKHVLAVIGGACFIMSGLLCLITMSWTTTVIINNTYDPFSTNGMKYEAGLCVYIGFASAIFSIFGGVVLCVTCCDMKNYPPQKSLALNAPGHQAHTSHRTDHDSGNISRDDV